MQPLSEDRIQADCVTWYKNTYCLTHHKPRNIIFSVPNGGRRGKVEAMTFKSTGLLPGVSDLIVIHFGTALFIEMKTPTGTQEPAQKDFQERIEAQGFRYILARSLQDFQQIFAL